MSNDTREALAELLREASDCAFDAGNRELADRLNDAMVAQSAASSPAPAQEPLTELVEALGTARPYVVAASTRYYDGVNGHLIRSEAVNRIAEIDALIAKHGQPQGGSNG